MTFTRCATKKIHWPDNTVVEITKKGYKITLKCECCYDKNEFSLQFTFCNVNYECRKTLISWVQRTNVILFHLNSKNFCVKNWLVITDGTYVCEAYVQWTLIIVIEIFERRDLCDFSINLLSTVSFIRKIACSKYWNVTKHIYVFTVTLSFVKFKIFTNFSKVQFENV